MKKAKTRIVCYGDSITADDDGAKDYVSVPVKAYTKWLNDLEPHWEVEARGFRGATIPEICNYILDDLNNHLLDDADVVTINGGINDFILNIDAEASYRELDRVVCSLQIKLPLLQIFLVVPHKVWKYEKCIPKRITDKYLEIFEIVSKDNSVPIIDWYNNSGLSNNNFRYYYTDNIEIDGIRAHLNSAGHLRLARVMYKEIKGYAF